MARQDRPHPVQRPAAASDGARAGHPVAPGGSDQARGSHCRVRTPGSVHGRLGAARSARGSLSAFAPKTVDPELEARRKKAEADQAAKVKAEEAKIASAKAENCDRAKEHMRTLDSGVRIARVTANGEREILDDKQRADETKRTRDIIAADCK
jgi:hypothetical protein